jgi:DNA-binding response OmpR family regulator
MLSQLLVLNDYEVKVARTVQEALGMAADDFDILISDIRLPDGSGLDLMRRLRSRKPIRGIAISGFGTEEDRRRSLDAGFGTHLTKPVDFNRLLAAIEKVAPPASE